MFSNSNIAVNRELCVACGTCVDRCIMDNLRLSVAPCRQACPLETNCQNYLRYLAKGRPEEAAVVLRKNTPFGAVLGRVCHHPCESKCQRNDVANDGAVHVRAVKRYLSDRFPAIVNGPVPCDPATGFTVAVVGAGPAGLAAAYELAERGHAVDLYEARPLAGGMLRYAIPAYRLPERIVDVAVRQATAMGVKLITGKKLGRDMSVEDLARTHDAVILALGLPESAVPPVPGHDGPRVAGALGMLADLRAGKRPGVASVVVVGGGNTAIDTALSLRKGGVDEVTVVTLEGPNELPMHDEELSEAREEGIRFMHHWGVGSIEDKGRAATVHLERCLALFDKAGRFAPEMDPCCTNTLDAELVVFAIGQKAEKEYANLRRADAEGGTGTAKVFAAGDCVKGATSVVQALAEGKRVATRVHRELMRLYPLVEDTWAARGMVRAYETPSREAAKGGARGDIRRLPVSERNLTDEVEATLSDEQALAEAGRCMACGRSYEENNTCWFCLPCEVSCPEKALIVNMPYLVR